MIRTPAFLRVAMQARSGEVGTSLAEQEVPIDPSTLMAQMEACLGEPGLPAKGGA